MATSPLMFDQDNSDQDQGDNSSSNPIQINTATPSFGTSGEAATPISPTITPMMQAAMAFISSQDKSKDNSGIRTAKIGNANILQTNSPGDQVSAMNDTVSQGLSGIASQFLQQKQMENRQNFVQSIHQIMSTNAPQQDKMNALLDLQSQHGTDYGLGLDGIAQKLGVNKQAPATMQSQVQQLMQLAGQNPDAAHSQAVKTIGADYATKSPELATAIQAGAQNSTLSMVDAAIKKVYGQNMQVDPVAFSKGQIKPVPQQAVSTDPSYSGLSPDQGLAQLKQQNPAYAAYLQTYADGRGGKISSSARSPQTQKLIQDLSYFYPGVDIDNINQRVDTLKDFSSAKTSQNITAFNTALQHLNTLNDLIPKMNNQGSEWFNGVAQNIEAGSGIGNNPNVAAFNNTKTALSGELATAYKASGATQEEINQIQKGINSAGNPDNLKAAVQNAAELLGGKLQALQDKWGNTFNSPGDPQGPGGRPIISSASQQILQKLGGGMESQSIGQPASIMTATNPQTKQRIQSTDGGQTWQPIQ